MHPGPHAGLGALADGQQLDHAAERPGALDVGRPDAGDSLAVHVRGGYRAVEGEPGEDGRLGRGVEALHVGGRVRLGVPEPLRLFQRVGEPGTRGVHPVQDVVGRAVDDAENPVHRVAGQRLAQRAQQRDRAGHRGLVVEVGGVLAGRPVHRGAVLGQQRLVRRDHRLARLHGREQQRAGRLDAADDLDHDVGIRPGHQLDGVGGEQRAVDPGRARPLQPPHRDPVHLDRGADPGGQVGRLLAQQPDDLRADHAAAQQGHVQRLVPGPLRHAGCSPHPGAPFHPGAASRHPASSRSRSSIVSRRTSTRAAPSRTAATAGRGTWL